MSRTPTRWSGSEWSKHNASLPFAYLTSPPLSGILSRSTSTTIRDDMGRLILQRCDDVRDLTTSVIHLTRSRQTGACGHPAVRLTRLRHLEDSICGYDMFRNDSVHGAQQPCRRRIHLKGECLRAQAAMARHDGRMTWLGKHVWCHARTFDGFPLKIHRRHCLMDAAFAVQRV